MLYVIATTFTFSPQGLYLDTVAYEHIVESVCAKAQELVISSPACKVSSRSDLLVKRYNIVRGVARVSCKQF